MLAICLSISSEYGGLDPHVHKQMVSVGVVQSTKMREFIHLILILIIAVVIAVTRMNELFKSIQINQSMVTVTPLQ